MSVDMMPTQVMDVLHKCYLPLKVVLEQLEALALIRLALPASFLNVGLGFKA